MVTKMEQKKRTDSFIRQAGILAAAGIICRIIGILYRSPLTAIIGAEGNGYYSTAYNIYTIILLISSYSIPSAISKVIAQRLALKEYRNAHRIFQCAILYVVVVGGLASIIAFLAAPILVEKNSVLVLRIFAPTIFLSGLLGVLRGYFQAHKTMLQTSFSQIMEQILNAVISVLAAYLLIQLVVGKDTTTRAIYGAAGSALGTGSGVVIALIFMLGIYRLNKQQIMKRVKKDRSRQTLETGEIFRIIISMVTPVILSTFIYNFSTSLNQTVFYKIMMYVKNMEESGAATLYGIFGGEAVVIANIPIAIASAMSASLIPSVSGAYATGDIPGTNRKINAAIKVTMFISIPAAVGIFVLARPVVLLLFPQKATVDMASGLLRALSITVIFYSLSTLTNAVLQGIGKVNIPVINAALSLGIQSLILIPLLYFTDLGLYSLVIATVCYSLSMCILNQISVKKILGLKQNVVRTYILPVVSSGVMGVVAILVYKGMYALIKSNVISLFLAIALAGVAYFATALGTGAMNREELAGLPKGRTLVRIAEKCRLIR